MYADRRSDYIFVLKNANTLSLGLYRPDCVGIGLGLGLGLEVVFRPITHVHDIKIAVMIS